MAITIDPAVQKATEELRRKYQAVREEIGKAIVGHTEIVDGVLTALFVGGPKRQLDLRPEPCNYAALKGGTPTPRHPLLESISDTPGTHAGHETTPNQAPWRHTKLQRTTPKRQ